MNSRTHRRKSTPAALRGLYTASGDPVIDLTPLGSLTQLRSVELSLPQIRDLTPLAALPNLQSVTIRGAENLDTSPLANVPQVNVE